MLVKINDSSRNNVKVTKLDIDDFGSVIPLRELDSELPQDDDPVRETLRHSSYAIVFTKDDSEVDGMYNNSWQRLLRQKNLTMRKKELCEPSRIRKNQNKGYIRS